MVDGGSRNGVTNDSCQFLRTFDKGRKGTNTYIRVDEPDTGEQSVQAVNRPIGAVERTQV